MSQTMHTFKTGLKLQGHTDDSAAGSDGTTCTVRDVRVRGVTRCACVAEGEDEQDDRQAAR